MVSVLLLLILLQLALAILSLTTFRTFLWLLPNNSPCSSFLLLVGVLNGACVDYVVSSIIIVIIIILALFHQTSP